MPQRVVFINSHMKQSALYHLCRSRWLGFAPKLKLCLRDMGCYGRMLACLPQCLPACLPPRGRPLRRCLTESKRATYSAILVKSESRHDNRARSLVGGGGRRQKISGMHRGIA